MPIPLLYGFAIAGAAYTVKKAKEKYDEEKNDIKLFGVKEYAKFKAGEFVDKQADIVIEKLDRFEDKIDVVFCEDTEIEGLKRGREKAAKEYEPVFQKIKKDYDDLTQYLKSEKSDLEKQTNILIAKLECLEKRRTKLEKLYDDSLNKIAEKFKITPLQLDAFRSEIPRGSYGTIFSSIYERKKAKINKAEKEGYEAVRRDYINKINNLKTELKRLKQKSKKEIQDIINMISDILDDISEEEMKIADLNILLKGD